jgi:PIN domain nuclease of toxin-antitoxin system
MRLLLDTHIMLSLAAGRPDQFGTSIAKALSSPTNALHVSVTSLWETVIKWRLGKLALREDPVAYPALLAGFGITILPLTDRHVVTDYDPEPTTRDPFDRILLSICRADDLKLVTADGALTAHPLAWHP